MAAKTLEFVGWAVAAATVVACGGDLVDSPAPPEAPQALLQAVTNGTPETARNTSFPEVVRVSVSVEGSCSGTLIDPHWVLTARHCLGSCDRLTQACDAGHRAPSPNGPVSGRIDIGPGGPLGFTRSIPVDQVLMPQSPGTKEGLYYDVALLHLAEPFWGKTAPLVADDEQFTARNISQHAGEPVKIVGYSPNEGQDDGTKRHGWVVVTGRDQGNEGGAMLLAGTPGDTCHRGLPGDSGGPAMVIGYWGDHRVAGVGSSQGKDYNCETSYAYVPNAFVNDVLWRQPFDNFGDSCADAAPLPPSGRLRASINHTGDWDVFAVDLAQSSELSARSLDVGQTSTDTFVELRDSRCRVVAHNDDGGAGRNFRIDERLTNGRYYLAVRHYSGSLYGTGAYELEVDITPQTDDHSNTTAGASVTRIDSYGTKVLRGVMDYNSDVDVFRLELSRGGRLEVAHGGTIPLLVRLADYRQSQLDSTQSTGPYPSLALAQDVSPGTYYVFVDGGGSASTGAYSVILSLVEHDDHPDSCSGATVVRRRQVVSGAFEQAGDIDVFRLDLPATSWVTVVSTGEVDTVGRLRDRYCGQIAFDDDGGEVRNFRIARRLGPGTYYIDIRPYSSATTGDYKVIIDPIN